METEHWVSKFLLFEEDDSSAKFNVPTLNHKYSAWGWDGMGWDGMGQNDPITDIIMTLSNWDCMH